MINDQQKIQESFYVMATYWNFLKKFKVWFFLKILKIEKLGSFSHKNPLNVLKPYFSKSQKAKICQN